MVGSMLVSNVQQCNNGWHGVSPLLLRPWNADPAHVPFAHHGVMGSRAMGTPMAIEMDKEAGSGMPWQILTTRDGGVVWSRTKNVCTLGAKAGQNAVLRLRVTAL